MVAFTFSSALLVGLMCTVTPAYGQTKKFTLTGRTDKPTAAHNVRNVKESLLPQTIYFRNGMRVRVAWHGVCCAICSFVYICDGIRRTGMAADVHNCIFCFFFPSFLFFPFSVFFFPFFLSDIYIHIYTHIYIYICVFVFVCAFVGACLRVSMCVLARMVMSMCMCARVGVFFLTRRV